MFSLSISQIHNFIIMIEKSRWDIVIIGAEIGGLAAAVSLAQKTSHSIRILERSHELKEAGAGIQISPSASRILTQWGFERRTWRRSQLLRSSWTYDAMIITRLLG